MNSPAPVVDLLIAPNIQSAGRFSTSQWQISAANIGDLIENINSGHSNLAQILFGKEALNSFVRISINNKVIPLALIKDSAQFRHIKLNNGDRIRFFSALAGG